MFPSPVNPLFTTNDAPNFSQTGSFRQEMLEISSSVLPSLNNKIARLEVRLLETKQLKEALEGRLKILKGVCHPIRRLPVEVLAHIFWFCVEEDVQNGEIMLNAAQSNEFPPPSLDTSKAPWVLGQVCRKWQEVASTTPNLWNVVEYNWGDINLLSGRGCPSAIDLLSLRLLRARNMPLSVSLNGACDYNTIPSFLISKSTRWESLTVRLLRSHFDFLAPCKGMLHALSTLHLHFKSFPPALLPDNHFLHGVFQNTPNLCHLTLSGNPEFIPFLSTQLPWKQITHFTTKGLSGVSLSRRAKTFYFQILPLLENVRVCRLEPMGTHAVTEDTLILHRLHSLVFTGRNTEGMATLSKYLLLPALRNLRLEDIGSQGVIDTVIRHSGGLEVLVFDGVDISVKELVQILGLPCLLNLHTLKILQPRVMSHNQMITFGGNGLGLLVASEELLYALSTMKNPAGVVYLPNLRHIVLRSNRGEWCWPDAQAALVDTVQSRMNGMYKPLGSFARLESLTIEGFDIDATIPKAMLDVLRKRGLRFCC
ncbi:hypothetical protein L218DRAFT_1080584 [Marasmius fiardii PR-910]|nr:hypothetical protein L218DRAFT_1080584 [Marasmius fiardii PR-910]